MCEYHSNKVLVQWTLYNLGGRNNEEASEARPSLTSLNRNYKLHMYMAKFKEVNACPPRGGYFKTLT